MEDVTTAQVEQVREGRSMGDQEISNEQLWKKLERIEQRMEKRLDELEEKIENSDSNGFLNFSDISKFQVTNGGVPTEEAEQLRKKVISEGETGLTTKDVQGIIDVSNPTASSKMEQMEQAFDDLEVYDPRENSRKPRYNQPKRLRHVKSTQPEFNPEQYLKREEKDKDQILCPECGESEAARKLWRESFSWECPNCGEDIKDSL